MAKNAADLIARINGAGSIDGLNALLGPAEVLKDPHRERMKRLDAIPEQYGQHQDKWPVEVLAEYERLCAERDRHDMLQAEELQYEAAKRR